MNWTADAVLQHAGADEISTPWGALTIGKGGGVRPRYSVHLGRGLRVPGTAEEVAEYLNALMIVAQQTGHESLADLQRTTERLQDELEAQRGIAVTPTDVLRVAAESGIGYQSFFQASENPLPNVLQDEAAQAWREIAQELSERLADVRPKLKDYEGHVLMDRAREAVLATYQSAASAEELRATAVAALGSLPYRKGSRFLGNPSDVELRDLERRAVAGDQEAQARLARELSRRGEWAPHGETLPSGAFVPTPVDPAAIMRSLQVGETVEITYENGYTRVVTITNETEAPQPSWVARRLYTTTGRGGTGLGTLELLEQHGRARVTYQPTLMQPVVIVAQLLVVPTEYKKPRVKPVGPRPIKLGTKRARRIFEQATSASGYHYSETSYGDSHFTPDLEYVRRRDGLESEAARMGVKSLRDDGGGKYTIRYHSNSWVSFTSPAEQGVGVSS